MGIFCCRTLKTNIFCPQVRGTTCIGHRNWFARSPPGGGGHPNPKPGSAAPYGSASGEGWAQKDMCLPVDTCAVKMGSCGPGIGDGQETTETNRDALSVTKTPGNQSPRRQNCQTNVSMANCVGKVQDNGEGVGGLHRWTVVLRRGIIPPDRDSKNSDSEM